MNQQTPETPKEESIFEDVQVDMHQYQKHINRARVLLFIIAGLQLLGIFLLDKTDDLAYQIGVGIQVVVAIAFAGLALWTHYKPYAALMTALILYVGLVVATIALDPSNLIRGILIKVIVVVLLIRGMSNAKEAEEIKKTFDRKS